MSPTQPLPPKKDVALALLERSSVYVHLDPRPPSVLVPARFKKQPKLVLQVGLNMALPILDLRLDDEGIGCTLSFDRSPFFCVVPWTSVFAMVGQDGGAMVWPDDVPAEVALQVKEPPKPAAPRELKEGALAEPESARSDTAETTKPKRPRRRPVLAAVSDAGGQHDPAKPPKVVRIEGGEPARRAGNAPVPSPRPAVGPAATPRIGGLRKKKKDLPPYLRVVK
jgi:hypothetical protein